MVLKINASSKSKVCLRRLRRRIERLSFDQSLRLKWLLTNLTKIRNKQGQKNLIDLTNNRVATHQKDKNSLTFHWPFINEKQSMFTFTLAFSAGHRQFSLHFQPLSARKKEFGKKALTRKPLTTTTTCVRRRVLIALLALWHTFRIFR